MPPIYDVTRSAVVDEDLAITGSFLGTVTTFCHRCGLPFKRRWNVSTFEGGVDESVVAEFKRQEKQATDRIHKALRSHRCQ